MTEKKTNNFFKITIAILALLLLIATYFSVKNYTELKDNQSAFETEKSTKVAELKSLQKQYNNLLVEDAANKEEITIAQKRIVHLLDSIKNVKPDLSVINKLRKSQNYFKGELKKLTAENELLKQRNLLLTTQKDSLSSELENSIVLYDSINKTNKELELVVAKAQKLNITNIASKSVRIKNSNKVVKTSRAKRTSGIEVCFDVAKNIVTETGDKELFIQVVSPSKKVIGGKYYFTEGERKLNFSKISKFRYQNKAITVCDFLEPLANETFEKGTYSVNVFNGIDLINTSTITLK